MKPPIWFFVFVVFLLVIGVFRDFIAGDRAIVQSTENGIEFPVLGIQERKGDLSEVKWRINPPIAYNPERMSDADRILLPPLSKNTIDPEGRSRHWLGTDGMGRDVMAGIIYGIRIALIIGILAGMVSLILGYCMGALAGYYGNDKLKVNILILSFLILLIGLYGYSIYWSIALRGAVSLIVLLIFVLLFVIAMLVLSRSRKFLVRIPMDTIIMRLIDFFSSIPALLILLVLTVVLRGWNVYGIAILIGFLRWPTLSRHVRAEVKYLSNSEEVEYAKGLGFSDLYILVRRIFLRSIQPALVVVAFVTASSIVLEATMSFLGLGLPPETMSWGTLVHQSRTYPDAWWLVLFPGLMLFIIVYGLNDWGRRINKAVHQSTR